LDLNIIFITGKGGNKTGGWSQTGDRGQSLKRD